MSIDHLSPVPLYRQVAEIIHRRILAGELAPELPIPSESAMVGEFGVARETARRAVAFLRQLGYVRTLPQRGTVVLPQENWPAEPPALS